MSIIELTEDNFSDTITPEATVVIDFWAPWCGPCRSFAPIFEKASHEHPDVVFAKVNTDEQEELASYFNIRSIPTIMVFRERVMLFAQPGALSAGQLDELLTKVKEVDMAKIHQEIAEQERNRPTDDQDEA